MDFNKVVKERATVKKYSSKKPPIEKIVELIETANRAFTHGNLHIINYIIIEDKETLVKISESCQQEFIKNVPYIIVILSDSRLVGKMYDKRADKYIKHHSGAVAENLLLKASNEGLATSWIGAFSEISLRSALNIPENIEIELLISVGYELIKGKTKQSLRQSLTNRLFFERYGNKFYKPIKSIRRSDM